ncbi:MAG TPA: VOC family protein [Candidatus Limnocylindrales bacterium]
MLRVGSVVIRVSEIPRMAAFWCAALDLEPRDGPLDPAVDFVVLRPRDGLGPNVSLDLKPSRYELPPRFHLDLYSDDRAAEVARLVALGAREVHWAKREPDADFVILEDPEGNRFCVIG